MSSTVNFNIRLAKDATKAQENDLLMKIYDAFKGSGTYLEMLFSPALVEFARLQILNDFSPQVDEYLSSDKETMLENDLKLSREATAIWEKDCNHAQKMYKNEKELKKELGEAKDAVITSLTNRLQGANETASKYYNEITKQDGLIEDLEKQVLSLKAQMFDMQNG